MANENRVEWSRKARDFVVGQIARQVPLWVPSAIFICQSGEYTGRDSSLTAWRRVLAEEVERKSPLGMEQTQWSWLRHTGQRDYCLFMTDSVRLQQRVAEQGSEGTVHFWFPAVLALCGKATDAEWRFLLEENCVTAGLFPAGQEIPQRVISRFYRSSGFSRSWQEVFAELRQMVSGGEEKLSALHRLQESSIWEDGSRLEVQHEVWNEQIGDWEPGSRQILYAEWLATANLRPLSAQEQSRILDARFNRYAWWGLQALATLLLILGVLWLGVLLKQSGNQRLTQLIQAEGPQVREIEKANDELLFLRNLTREQGNVFDWLLVLNANRPAGVVFETFQLAAAGKIEVRGVAGQHAEISSFREKLDQTGEFRKLNLNAGKSDREGTLFTLTMETVRNKPIWEPVREETSQQEPAAESSSEAPTADTPAVSTTEEPTPAVAPTPGGDT